MTTQIEQPQPDTIASRVYKQLRKDIISGVFPPGAHLVKRVLAKKYGVSVPPVIEACLRLGNDGLVESSPLVGSFVPLISPEKLEEEHIFREAIECQISRVYAVRASDADRTLVLRLAESLDEIETDRKAEIPEINRRYQKMHFEYHMVVAKLSRVKLLYSQMEKVWFRRLVFVWNVDKRRFPTPPNWHVKLTQALNSGNPERAEVAMREHFNINAHKKTETLPASMFLSSDYFDDVISKLPDADHLLNQ